MKKIFALALAAVMTAGMTTVAFAADDDVVLETNVNFFHYDSDENCGVYVGNTNDGRVESLKPGETYYIGLDADDANTILTSTPEIEKSDVTGYKVYADWKVEGIEIDDLKIEYKKVQLYDESESDWDQTGYRYVVVLEIPESTSASSYDLAGTIKVAKTSSAAKKAEGVNLDVTVANNYIAAFEGDFEEFDNGAVVKFVKDLGEIDIDFGEAAMFTVDVTGQGKLNLIWNNTFDSEIADLDKSANMDFLTFEGEPRFNKNGTLYIYADADTFLYQVVDGKLEAVKAEYNEDYEAWELTTRTLGKYVISDKELDLETINTEVDDKDDASSTTDGGKENPDTGR